MCSFSLCCYFWVLSLDAFDEMCWCSWETFCVTSRLPWLRINFFLSHSASDKVEESLIMSLSLTAKNRATMCLNSYRTAGTFPFSTSIQRRLWSGTMQPENMLQDLPAYVQKSKWRKLSSTKVCEVLVKQGIWRCIQTHCKVALPDPMNNLCIHFCVFCHNALHWLSMSGLQGAANTF